MEAVVDVEGDAGDSSRERREEEIGRGADVLGVEVLAEGRVGFGVVAVDGSGKCRAAAYAPMAFPLQKVQAGEIAALEFAIRHSEPGVVFGSDCKAVVDGINAGDGVRTVRKGAGRQED